MTNMSHSIIIKIHVSKMVFKKMNSAFKFTSWTLCYFFSEWWISFIGSGIWRLDPQWLILFQEAYDFIFPCWRKYFRGAQSRVYNLCPILVLFLLCACGKVVIFQPSTSALLPAACIHVMMDSNPLELMTK